MVTFFVGKNMGFPSFFSKSFLHNCKKITTKEMAQTMVPINYESCGSCALIRKGPSAMKDKHTESGGCPSIFGYKSWVD